MASEIKPDLIILGEGCLLPESLAEQIGVKINTLAVWRSKGKGPEYRKLGNNIVYPIPSTIEWFENQ